MYIYIYLNIFKYIYFMLLSKYLLNSTCLHKAVSSVDCSRRKIVSIED